MPWSPPMGATTRGRTLLPEWRSSALATSTASRALARSASWCRSWARRQAQDSRQEELLSLMDGLRGVSGVREVSSALANGSAESKPKQ
jgi:hypothetical protein